jgi:hypothetical protein
MPMSNDKALPSSPSEEFESAAAEIAHARQNGCGIDWTQIAERWGIDAVPKGIQRTVESLMGGPGAEAY